MNAIISGRCRRALIIDGELLTELNVDSPSRIVPRRKSDLPYFFGEAADLRILQNTTMAFVRSELEGECNFTSALDLTLISLDSELPKRVREEALDGLGNHLANIDTCVRLADVLYADTFPEDADLIGALSLCNTQAAIKSHEFLFDIESRQPSISAVKQTWEAIPTKHFGSYETRRVFRQTAIRTGIFRELVWSESEEELRVLKNMLPPNIIAFFPNAREVLQVWIDNLRSVKTLTASFSLRRRA